MSVHVHNFVTIFTTSVVAGTKVFHFAILVDTAEFERYTI